MRLPMTRPTPTSWAEHVAVAPGVHRQGPRRPACSDAEHLGQTPVAARPGGVAGLAFPCRPPRGTQRRPFSRIHPTWSPRCLPVDSTMRLYVGGECSATWITSPPTGFGQCWRCLRPTLASVGDQFQRGSRTLPIATKARASNEPPCWSRDWQGSGGLTPLLPAGSTVNMGWGLAARNTAGRG